MTTTTNLTEPANGAIRVIRDRDGDTVPVQRDDAHPTANGRSRWLDLTCPARERTANPWFTLGIEAMFKLGEPVDPATTQEPNDGTHVVVKRVNTKNDETNWYTVRRDDSAPSELDEDDEDHNPDARWRLDQCYAEWDADWGDAYGNFTWAELGRDGFPHNTVTVYPLVEPAEEQATT